MVQWAKLACLSLTPPTLCCTRLTSVRFLLFMVETHKNFSVTSTKEGSVEARYLLPISSVTELQSSLIEQLEMEPNQIDHFEYWDPDFKRWMLLQPSSVKLLPEVSNLRYCPAGISCFAKPDPRLLTLHQCDSPRTTHHARTPPVHMHCDSPHNMFSQILCFGQSIILAPTAFAWYELSERGV
jgi:hypothetical protein